jgi:hypothetical protein
MPVISWAARHFLDAQQHIIETAHPAKQGKVAKKRRGEVSSLLCARRGLCAFGLSFVVRFFVRRFTS